MKIQNKKIANGSDATVMPLRVTGTRNALTALASRLAKTTVAAHQALGFVIVVVLATLNSTLAQSPRPLSPGDNCKRAPKSSV